MMYPLRSLRRGKRWEAEEDEALRHEYYQGLHLTQIAVQKFGPDETK